MLRWRSQLRFVFILVVLTFTGAIRHTTQSTVSDTNSSEHSTGPRKRKRHSC